MSKVKGYPGKQSFNVTARRNLTKQKAWWQVGKDNNRKQGKSKSE